MTRPADLVALFLSAAGPPTAQGPAKKLDYVTSGPMLDGGCMDRR